MSVCVWWLFFLQELVGFGGNSLQLLEQPLKLTAVSECFLSLSYLIKFQCGIEEP